MKFNTIRIEGSILSADTLDKIGQGELGGQIAKDFGFDSSVKVKDEIVKAWADAQDLWRIFKRHRTDVPATATGTSETRRYWILPLLSLIGYELELSKSELAGGKTYAISHRAKNLDGFPVHIMGFNDSLDKKREDSGPRMSPHALVQEYLNLTEHLYAIVTNGMQLRLLRDSSRLVKLSFIEFDLEAMMEEEQYADFAIMYRLVHATRMPVEMDAGSESLIEKYHQDALDSGSRIRDGLSVAVKFSIESLANGFLRHPGNPSLRQECENKNTTGDIYYKNLLRLIYRLLFLMVIEQRDLIYPKNVDRKKREIYYNFYSIARLRKLCERTFLEEDHFDDLWTGLKNTFRLFETESKGRHLDIKPLAGDLFGYDSIGILSSCRLDNKTLLECLKNLSVFNHPKTGQKMRVNYASLNTEEFGSVYEGLLEYSPEIINENGGYKFVFVQGSERSATGSHYTPDELVLPLIKHSLDYIIEDKLKAQDPEKALLSIRVCDVAGGSGHILLNAARRIGAELAKVRTGEDQPSPTAYRTGVRDAIRSCIYGADKNPLAVELCKVSLWLEAHIPGEPLNFLDHHIKCGDSIVGLAHKEELLKGIATEAFKKLPGDDPDVAKRLARKNKEELNQKTQLTLDYEQVVIADVKNIAGLLHKLDIMPEHTPAEIEAKQKEYQKLTSGSIWWRLKNLADISTAQFFIPKTKENENKFITDAEYREYLAGRQMIGMGVAKATEVALDKRFFHWFLAFPEVFMDGGFDCILGNPPFLGGSKISGSYSEAYLNFLMCNYIKTTGRCDLVGFFFRRIYDVLKNKNFLSLISTNTIAQGDTRQSVLDYILKNQGDIVFAIKSIKWPGKAAVEVSLIAISKQRPYQKRYIGNKEVQDINSLLEEGGQSESKAYNLYQNESQSFEGVKVMGTGFIINEETSKELICSNPQNSNVIFPYLNGDDLNSSFDQKASRWVINFFDWPIEKAKAYKDCFDIIEDKVRPVRMAQNDQKAKDYWWIYQRPRPELTKAIKKLQKVIVIAKTSKSLAFTMVDTNQVLNANLSIISFDDFFHYSVLQSNIHIHWAWKFCTTMKTDLIYTPTTIYQPFPFPQNVLPAQTKALECIGEAYHEYRRQLMLKMKLGLTKTYNQFHNKRLAFINGELQDKEIEKQYGKETLILRNHLQKTQSACSFNEAVEGILELRRLHKEMDETVLKAYNWTDIDLAHNFYEVEYLPENDRIRYTISPDSRREILKRLLQLNHEIHAKEMAEAQQSPTKKKPGKGKKKIYNDKQPTIGF